MTVLRSLLLLLSRLNKLVLAVHRGPNVHLRGARLNRICVVLSQDFLLVLMHDNTMQFDVGVVHYEVFGHVALKLNSFYYVKLTVIF